MAFQTWQVGLDIQNGQLCAIAIQRRRNGWQLRHWWQHTLPQDTLRNGLVQRPEILISILQRWRRLLPSRIALRVGFPPQLVMQRQLSLPATHLREAARSDYIHAAAKRFFPIEPEALALDFRLSDGGENQLTLTATRREALQGWLDCLQQVGLIPDVIDLTPSALSVLARALMLAPDASLVHRLSDHWLWYSPQHAERPWGWCPREDIADFSALQQRYLPPQSAVWYSSALDDAPPQGTMALSPFAALQFLQPPLPVCGGAYTIAAGLAMRPEDR
ncbi:type IV pilus biogenesis protein PilM [Erwinia sp. S38]|uniref:type IV pilus biogenesis protein PilM n=1 Tax=Erwinia sp. S38 TaxID=2769338 RepID=UPI00190B4864|nr:pilus assembly protein PilM [Erwinia sp. S38]MBK0003086.1 pilus assembly protein PilM [Erwinia sp. S38]